MTGTAAASAPALWLAVAAIGAWHGLNPAMGWPLAVANGMTERRGSAVFATLLPLGAGHFMAMAVVLLPFALLASVLPWAREIRIAAGALVLMFGIFKLLKPRHPRLLARVKPTQVALWSFLMASAHGAGLMLLPFALGLCEASRSLVAPGASTAVVVTVALLHTMAMLTAGTSVAWFVYRVAGLGALTRGWLDLDTVWGASLVLAGAAGMVMALG